MAIYENLSPNGHYTMAQRIFYKISILLNRKIRTISYADYQLLSQAEKDDGTQWCVYGAPDTTVLKYYPVGSYYETSDTTFDPNTEWGGTWVLEAEGLVHISSGTNYVVSANDKDGGEATHLLTSSESGVQPHAHGASSGIGYISSVRIVGAVGTLYSANQTAGYGSTSSYKDVTNTSNFPAANHTHSITVNNATAKDATTAHNNMQPYKIVNRWHRTA